MRLSKWRPSGMLVFLSTLCRVTRAHLLLRSSVGHPESEGRLEIARSKALMLETGAMLFNRFINELEDDHSNASQIPSDRTALS